MANRVHTRDELIYLAKLAEQCERYDGKFELSDDCRDGKVHQGFRKDLD